MSAEQPFVPAQTSLRELTFKALALGVVLAAVLGAANAYLGIKAGQTVSATFPAAVIAIAAFRLPFMRGTILEQNITRSAASVGEALVAGAIFTLPAFVMVSVGGERLWTKFNYWEASFILLVGGVLGILFITLLRRTLTVDARLPFPESRACFEIVKAGQGDATGARSVFGALGLGMLIQVFKDGSGIQLFRESVEFARRLPGSVVHHFSGDRQPLGDIAHGGLVVAATPAVSPALMSVGYIVGFRIAALSFSGALLAWLVFIPFALFVDPDLPARLSAGGEPPATGDLVFSVWYNLIRPIAVGAMLVGAATTMWRMRDSIATAFRGAFRRGTVGERTRLERDLDLRTILVATIALAIPMTLVYWHFSGGLVGAAIAAIVMLALGFLFSAVGGYLVGLVGGSNQPISGLALSTLLIAALLMVAFGVTGLGGIGAVLAVAAVVCCATSVSGGLIQDLEIGRLLGGTPWKMQVAELVSTVIVAFVLVFPIMILHESNLRLGGIGIGDPELPAPQAGLMAQLAAGIVGGEMPWGLILFGVAFGIGLVLLGAASPMLIAVGMYLPFETTAAIFVGGCLKTFLDWRLAKRAATAATRERVESAGVLLASGLIAGESLTGVFLASLVLVNESFRSLTQTFFGVETFGFVDGPAGAWLALVPLAVIAWVLVGLPLRRAR